jgi:hypothetical protein
MPKPSFPSKAEKVKSKSVVSLQSHQGIQKPSAKVHPEAVKRKKLLKSSEHTHSESTNIDSANLNGSRSDTIDEWEPPGAETLVLIKQAPNSGRLETQIQRSLTTNSSSVKKNPSQIKHVISGGSNGKAVVKVVKVRNPENGHIARNCSISGKLKKRPLNDSARAEGNSVVKRPYKRRDNGAQTAENGIINLPSDLQRSAQQARVMASEASSLPLKSAANPAAASKGTSTSLAEGRRSGAPEPGSLSAASTTMSARPPVSGGKTKLAGCIDRHLKDRRALLKPLKIKAVGAAGPRPAARALLSPRGTDGDFDSASRSPRSTSSVLADWHSSASYPRGEGGPSPSSERRAPVARRSLVVPAVIAPLEEGWQRSGSPFIGRRGMRYAAESPVDGRDGGGAAAVAAAAGHAGRIVAWMPEVGGAPAQWRLRYDNADVGEEDLAEDE